MDRIPYPMEEETYTCTCNDICACPIKNELKAIEYDLKRAMENDEQDIKSIEYNIFKSPNPDEQDRKTVQYNITKSMTNDDITPQSMICTGLTARPARHDVVSRAVECLGAMPQVKTLQRDIHLKSILKNGRPHWPRQPHHGNDRPHQCKAMLRKRPKIGAQGNQCSYLGCIIITIIITTVITSITYFIITTIKNTNEQSY